MSKLLLISNLLLGEKTVRVAEGDAPNSFGKSGGNPWDALRASRIGVSKKPLSKILVGKEGLEPSSLAALVPKTSAYTNSATYPTILT